MDELKVRAPRPLREAERVKDAGPSRRGGGGGGGPVEMSNALEALRIASTYFVVLYHASLAYLATPMRLTLWLAFDPAGHVAFDYFVYWVNGFAMPFFFLAAGVSAPAACEARGSRVFLSSRARRLLRPMLFGCLTIMPFTYVIWGYGLMATGECDLENIMRWRFGPRISHHLYGLGHLWFLEYLFVVCVLWCGARSLRGAMSRGAATSGAVDEGGWASKALASPWRPLWLAIPTALIFCVDPDTMLRVDNALIPDGCRLLHYAYFFTVGGWISKARDPKGRFIPYSTLYLVLSFVLFAAMSPLLLQHAATPLEGWPRIVHSVLAALFPWLTVFGGLGVLLGVLRGRGAVMRYLAESSFWVYIGHLPVIALAQVLLLAVPMPAPAKFLIVAVSAIAVSLLSYEYIVRRSLIGEIVNGSRKRTARRGLFGPEFGWIATVGVLAISSAGVLWSSREFLFGNNLHEEIPGQFYRSARLSDVELADLIQSKGLRTVITCTAGGDRHPWYLSQKRVCQSRRVELRPIDLRADRLPTRETLSELIDVLEDSSRPILVQSNRGLDPNGFAAAVALLLEGVPPAEALGQFGTRHGQFGGPEHSLLGLALLDYQRWLDARQWTHDADRFRAWADEEYMIHSVPARNVGVVARGAREPSLAR